MKLNQWPDHLNVLSMQMGDIAFISVYLSEIDLFPRVNVVYGEHFGTSPPARACVAVDLPKGVRVRMDCIASVTGHLISPSRQALHVQGLSYWAPANIGPYSQAILVIRPSPHHHLGRADGQQPTDQRTTVHIRPNRTHSEHYEPSGAAVARTGDSAVLPACSTHRRRCT
jgi:hypothetical protein